MKAKLLILLQLLPIFLVAQSSDSLYDKAFESITQMLSHPTTTSFKEAVFLVENAYLDGQLNQKHFNTQIQGLTAIVKGRIASDNIIYEERDKEKVKKYAALFSTLKDSTEILIENELYYHLPFVYDFEDIFGDKDWTKMFVSKLLSTKKGNCHSLPYLYKILGDEINAATHLAISPSHLYIKHLSQKTGWYNTELTSGFFPVDAWMMASGYIYLEAIQNGLYLKALTEKEMLAMCLIDLAMGYDKKYPQQDGLFILKCCDTALTYFPNYPNSLLLKAETWKKQFEFMMKQQQATHPQEIFHIQEAKQLWAKMEKLYVDIFQLGYRHMPKQMYVDWLSSIEQEKEKYQNSKVKFKGQ